MDKPPIISESNYVTDSQLKRFKIGFANLVYIDFENVKFITGSNVKDDFKVNIRNVNFSGALTFVDKFKEYLSTIDDNLVFDLSPKGASVGYGITLPNFTAGYFNFFNLNLSALLTLPFDPTKSLQLRFGFGNELNKFGLTVGGAFGGQGYFNLIAEPKRGIVGMIVVLEFGAIFNLRLPGANGTAYLVGGVYIQKYKGEYDIRAYILAVGRLRIVSLFSASLSFYVGLEGNGSVLEGVAKVTASKRFSRWYKVSVTCRFRKKLKGAKSKGSKSGQGITIIRLAQNPLALGKISETGFIYGVIDYTVFDDDILKIRLNVNSDSGLYQCYLSNSFDNMKKQEYLSEPIQVQVKPEGIEGNKGIAEVKIRLSQNYLEGNKEHLFFSIKASKDSRSVLDCKINLSDIVKEELIEKDESTENLKNYYKSYYYLDDE